MRIAACQINPTIGDFDKNRTLIREDAERAKERGCDLAVFPELALSGYPPKDLLEKASFVFAGLEQLKRLAKETRGIPLLCGYVDINPAPTGKGLINGVALLDGGRILKKGGKRLLPTYDVFDEARYFEPAEQSLHFELGGKRIGITICEDIWNVGDMEGIPNYSTSPVEDLNKAGLDLLINIAASPYTLSKQSVRMEIIKRLARSYGVPVLVCNQVGGNDDLLFDGTSMVVNASGELEALGKEFETDLLVWDMEKDLPLIPFSPPLHEVSVLKGLIMGTRDYIRKCGFSTAMVGLSGGIDSSLVAFIAERALGAENVLGVSMPSPYTSAMSREDARELADTLHIGFQELPITDIYASYKSALTDLFEGRKEDETEENIQARIRGTLLMALSNKFGALLLSTGNKSEMAMGYCTLYGDMSGGLAVISDVPKTLCYRIAHHINREEEIIPQRVITRPPSAELRPDQTDQDVLPPYDVLDDIIDSAVVMNLSYEEILARGHDPQTVMDVLRRLDGNEYKRRQAPPGLKITTKAFGYGRRYPIARGKGLY